MNKKVVLGMSGGVDSSVAALLLKKKGYEVHGYFMNCGVRGKSKFWPSGIDWKEDEKILREICDKLKIDLHMADCEIGYEKNIIEPMVEDYKNGLTPNPDILCNTIGKFPNLIKIADKIEADFIATGHYARVKNGKLFRGKDKEKDQSYFLASLDENILRRCIFPIGDLIKFKVRDIARKNKFPNYNKRSSRGICYLGKINFKEFLKSRIKESMGSVIDSKGEIIGGHHGQMFFTIGERIGESKGIELNKLGRKKYSGKKLFIAEKMKGNVLVAAEKGDKILKTKKVWIKELHLIDKNEEVDGKMFRGRIRHLGELLGGELEKNNGRWTFVFDKGVEGVAPGQWIVLHKGERVVGGGEMILG
ncbi:tRNA 2-thiouridine(34) synthase MnmA [Candidatus Pacearchaeota archaeon]|nr:tRNA 2-thiouridine(34) synthase MnmA [Candidatus Pacearchaeota archaeon]